MRIWIDVEDLFQYAANTSRPSGIQRLAFELQRALLFLAPGEVHFVRHNSTGTEFVSVQFSDVNALFVNLSDAQSASAKVSEANISVPPLVPVEAGPPPAGFARRMARRAMALLPPEIARSIRHFRIHQREALGDLRDVARLSLKRRKSPVIYTEPQAVTSAVEISSLPQESTRNTPFKNLAEEGDWLLCLGSPWFLQDYAGLIRNSRVQYGLRFGVLLYDIIPLRRPEWCDRNLVRAFKGWFHSVVPLADAALSISNATARDVEAYMKETGLTLPGPVKTIPLGTGFGRPPAPVRSPRLPPANSYALIVSTIEARKNHILLFRIWRELLSVMPRAKVPTLVFAGRVGWLVADLMQQLQNANWLEGKILLIEEPSDGELVTLYEDCLFTLYPSLYEGWGLPVTESLAYGAPCLAADCTSIPEAGGDFARYFDPDNLHDAIRAVRALLDNPQAIAEWRNDIRRNFRNPPSWKDSAAATLEILGHPASFAKLKIVPPESTGTC